MTVLSACDVCPMQFEIKYSNCQYTGCQNLSMEGYPVILEDHYEFIWISTLTDWYCY